MMNHNEMDEKDEKDGLKPQQKYANGDKTNLTQGNFMGWSLSLF